MMTDERQALPKLLKRNGHRPWWVRGLYVTAAAGCLVLGIVGWVIPFVTGLPFYVLALFFLANASDRVRRWINERERRLPHRWRLKLRAVITRMRMRWKSFWTRDKPARVGSPRG
jgi:uncharacterized membrane protein YbaN (DUF454 family)